MIATVREVSAGSTVPAVRHRVRRSTSTTTGVAPQSATAAAVAMNVADGTTTSSPGPTPTARSAISSATVPLLTATPCGTPTHAAKSRSKRCPCSPVQ
jgi:hypothetical protein